MDLKKGVRAIIENTEDSQKSNNKTSKALMFYHEGLPIMHQEQMDGKYKYFSEDVIRIMNEHHDVPYYLIQTISKEDKFNTNRIKIFRNHAFDFEYVKVRGNQSGVMVDAIKTILYSEKQKIINNELKIGRLDSLRNLLSTIVPLYRGLYDANETGMFAVPIMTSKEKQWRFGISVIIKLHDEDIHYLDTQIMDDIGFVEEDTSCRPWFMIEGVMEQKDMPENLRKFYTQINDKGQSDSFSYDTNDIQSMQ